MNVLVKRRIFNKSRRTPHLEKIRLLGGHLQKPPVHRYGSRGGGCLVEARHVLPRKFPRPTMLVTEITEGEIIPFSSWHVVILLADMQHVFIMYTVRATFTRSDAVLQRYLRIEKM